MNISLSPRRFFFLILFALMLVVYGRVVFYPFLSFDDNFYIYQNPYLKDGFSWNALKWAFTADLFYDSVNVDYWQPVTALSRVIDSSLFGMWAGGHHLTNLLLHITNVSMLFILMFRVSRAFWKSAIVTALFALHPMQVEVVAWATARKDLLSGCFILWSALYYVRSRNQDSSRNLAVGAFFYGLSLLSKPNMFLFPLGLLLVELQNQSLRDRANWKGCAIKLRPYLLTAVCFVAISVLNKSRIVAHVLSWEWFSESLGNFGFYLPKLFFPVRLGIYKPLEGQLIWYLTGIGFVLLVIIALILILSYKRGKWFIFFGLVFYMLSIAESAQIKIADRVLYLPQVGIWIAVVWGLSELFEKRFQLKRFALFSTIFLILSAFTFQSYRQVSLWKDTKTLFEHSAALSDGHYLADNILGGVYDREGRIDLAVKSYTKAMQEKPDYLESTLNLGALLLRHGQAEQAIEHFELVTKARPDFAEAHNLLGDACTTLNRVDCAEREYVEAVRLKPDYVTALNNLGNVLLFKGRAEEAILKYQEALQADPAVQESLNNLAVVYELTERYDEAYLQYQRLLKVNPNYEGVNLRIAKMLKKWGKLGEARFYFQKALEESPSDPEIQKELIS